MPDLKQQENNDNAKKAKNEPLTSFAFDNTNRETEKAMIRFQRLYSSKRSIIMIIAYVVLLGAACALAVFNPKNPIPYIAMVLCVIFIFFTATAKSRRRKKILKYMDTLPPEDYECTLYEDKIEIKTFVKTDNPQDKPVIQIIPFKGEYTLDFVECDDFLLLIADGRQYFCFPMRCMSDEQTKIMRSVLKSSVSDF